MQEPKLKIETARVEDLVPYAHNAKEHPDEQIEQIARSMLEFGNCDPIAIWHNERGEPEIVEGHGRLQALQSLGREFAPVIALDHLTDEQRRAYTHIHNQTTLSSGFNLETLSAEIAALDFDWEAFGFDDMGAPDLGEFTESEIDEAEIPEFIETRCSRGDVWALGDHRLVCGDSTEAEDFARLMDGELADLLLTDPPYNVSLGATQGHPLRPSEAKQRHRRTDGKIIENDSFSSDAEFVAFLQTAFERAHAAMRDGAAFYIWFGSTKEPQFREASSAAGMDTRQVLIWNKSLFALGRQDYQWKHEACLYGWRGGAAHYFTPERNLPTVIGDEPIDVDALDEDGAKRLLREMLGGLEYSVMDAVKPVVSKEHPTMKPVKLMARLIRNATRRGELVLDPFGGSGSTLMAAEQMGRRCRTMELDPHYCDVIIRRWEQLTGREAVRLA